MGPASDPSPDGGQARARCEDLHGQAHVLCVHVHLRSYTDSSACVEWARLEACMFPDS